MIDEQTVKNKNLKEETVSNELKEAVNRIVIQAKVKVATGFKRTL